MALRSWFLLSCCFPVAGCFIDAVGTDGAGGSPPGGGGADTTSSSASFGSGAGGAGTGGSGQTTSSTASTSSSASTGTGGASSVGDCMVQPPEICDDCNAVGGDGCDSSGTVEQGWLCATAGQACLHFSGVSSVNGGVISAGGSGGTAFDEACPFGSALVGFDGDWDGTDLKRLRGHCGAMFATSTGSVQWSTSTPTAYYGNQDQALGNIDCPTTHFVVGFDVNFKSTGGMQVGGFKLKCATLGFDGQGMVTGAPQTLAQYSGLGGTTQSPSCPQGQVAVRFTGRAGGKFDRLGATCASLTPTFCGDGTMSGFESCDDGNAVSGDGCSTLCQTP